MRISFRLLGHVNQVWMVEQCAIAFRNLFQLRHQIGEFLNVPATDVTHDPLSLGSCCSGVRISVVLVGGMPEPRKTSQTLAFRQHVDATLVCPDASACTSRSDCSFAIRGQSRMSPLSSGRSNSFAYSGGR